MSNRYEMRFAGSGGQGVILASVIMAEAAVIAEAISRIGIGGKTIGPADWLLAAYEVLCGAETVMVEAGREQLPSLDRLPLARDLSLKGTWIHSDSFEDNWLSDRLRWQSWTMRF